MELKKFIGSKIKYYRESNGMSQEELAELLKTTKQSISRYENGIRQANQDVLFNLSDVFNVSVDDFFPKRDKRDDELERALMLIDNLDLKDMDFLNELIEKTLSLKGEERAKFLESIKFTVEYYNKMND